MIALFPQQPAGEVPNFLSDLHATPIFKQCDLHQYVLKDPVSLMPSMCMTRTLAQKLLLVAQAVGTSQLFHDDCCYPNSLIPSRLRGERQSWPTASLGHIAVSAWWILPLLSLHSLHSFRRSLQKNTSPWTYSLLSSKYWIVYCPLEPDCQWPPRDV